MIANRSAVNSTMLLSKAESIRHRADSLTEQGDYAAAECELLELAQLLSLGEEQEPEALIGVLHELGLLCHVQDKLSAGENALRCALRLAERHFGLDDPIVHTVRESLTELCDERDNQFTPSDLD